MDESTKRLLTGFQVKCLVLFTMRYEIGHKDEDISLISLRNIHCIRNWTILYICANFNFILISYQEVNSLPFNAILMH